VIIRLIVFGLPAAIAALLLAAFINASFLSSKRQNEMSIGTLGEPTTLNPIQAADASSSQVTSLIFNGLLQYDANLEIKGDLARSWSLSQTSTFCFENAQAAAAALARFEELRTQHPEWKLDALQISPADPTKLLIDFTLPGLQATAAMADQLPEGSLQPLHTLRVTQTGGARESLPAFLASGEHASILRSWIETGGSYELTVRGDTQPILAALEAFYSTTPDLKAAWEVTDTASFLAEPRVVFELRDDVRWHDGAPFTSADVVFTYEAIMDESVASPRKPDFDLIGGITTEGPHRLTVTYRKPYSPALSSWMMAMLPSHLLKDKPAAWWVENFNRRPVGTGPFQFAEWKTNEFVRVKRNPDYFLKPGPWLESVVFRVLPDPLTLRLAFETRQVDFWSADPWAVRSFEKDDRFQVFSAPSNSYSYIGWNLRRPLFQDEQVRIALAHAVNVPQMIRYILYGHGVQSTGIFSPELWFFDPNVQAYEFDPEKAQAMLEKAGWVRGRDGIRQKDGKRFSFTLLVNNGNEVRRDIATLVQDDLRRVGIEVKVEIYEWAVFLKNFIDKGEFDACVLGWSLSRDHDQYQIWHSSQVNPGQLNFVGFKNEQADALIEDLRQEYDRDAIIRLASELQNLIYREQPYLFLYVPDGTSVMWREAYRIRRPDGKGGWIDSEVEMTKAGWSFFLEWFYRPEYADLLPPLDSPSPMP